MKRDPPFLAGYGSPGATMTEYSSSELGDPACVEELFDYCQILHGFISALGWRFLLATHGVAGLLEIDRKSGWLDASEEDAADALKYQCLIAGYDPETDTRGNYDELSGIFINEDETSREIAWGVPWVARVQPV